MTQSIGLIGTLVADYDRTRCAARPKSPMRLSANSVCETNGRALAGLLVIVQADSLTAFLWPEILQF